jgi:hypothetical protein
VLRVFGNANPTPEGLNTYRELLQNAGYLVRDAGIDPDDLDDPRLDPRSPEGRFAQGTVWVAIGDFCVAEIEAAIGARLHKRRRVNIGRAQVVLPGSATCSTPQRRLPYT